MKYKIGEQLKALREEKGLSVRQLEEKSGVSYANISRIENGKYNASLEILEKICNALDCTLEVVVK